MSDEIKKIGILGGTGALGSALTKKWAVKGYEILIGSRDPVKAQKIAIEVAARAIRIGIVSDNTPPSLESGIIYLISIKI